MKYYFSDSYISQEIEDFVSKYAKNRLISYAYEASIKKYIKIYSKYHQNTLDLADYSLLIDSGAYSVWNSGKPPISREKYANFCGQLLKTTVNLPFKCIEFINLDQIPGVRNEPLTVDQIKQAEEKSWENYIWLHSRVQNMLPVFHQGDGFNYITEIEKYTLRYCVSPANDKSVSQRMLWIQDVFRCANINFQPHGLGFSNTTLAKANPWFSFDASTHSLRAGFGVVMYANENNLIDIVFSDVRTSADTGAHFFNLSPLERKHILNEFLSINPIFTLENIVKSGKYRRMLNMYYVSQFYENLKLPDNYVQESLFM